ncbi:hypothetical protein C8J56DRAFT_882775 [Mycena floridula]|nr:hypothetical protein C8J56DRAFT_882775 [Mycena floridula]
MDSSDIFAAMGISGFGKSSKKAALDPTRFDKARREDDMARFHCPPPPAVVPSSPGPSRPPLLPKEKDESSTIEPEYDPEQEFPSDEQFHPFPEQEDDGPQFPITHELILKDHTKVVSALTLDPSGARIVSGSHDYDCKMWDFGGMDLRCKPFKSFEPAGSYYIHDIKYSNDGQKYLLITGTTQARLYDRDGEEQATFVKGDPYIRDMKNTSGHVGELSSCCWHPKDPKIFITSSADSTIRIWDVENRRKQKTVIVVKSKDRGARTKVTACSYSPDGTMIAGACSDGALHIWQTSSNFVRPNSSIEGAHTKGTDTGSLVFSVDGRTILTRGGDDTVKLWDIRAFKKPLASRGDIATLYPNTNAIFSPDGKHVITGAGATAKGGKGKLMFMSKDSLDVVKTLEMRATPVRVFWHSKINQIVTGLSNGEICVLYSPLTSLNGAKLLMNKGPPRKVTVEDMSDALAAPSIHTPGAGEYGDGIIQGNKRKREKDRLDPRKSRRPELPVTGPGRGGRVGASATQHVVQNLVRDNTRDEDPREALLKYANSDPMWTAGKFPPFFCRYLALSDVASLLSRDWNLMNSPPSLPAVDNDEHKVVEVVVNGVNKLNGCFPESKIDIDSDQPESDARHEPMPTKSLDVDDASNVPQVGTPSDHQVEPNGIDMNTEPVNDVELNGELKSEPNGDLDVSMDLNVAMDDVRTHTPTTTPGIPDTPTTNGEMSTYTTPAAMDEDDKPPPAKRPRVHSDADQASIAHSTVRSLKKVKDAAPFLRPVDAVALNIPHYPITIKNPMDFSTVERKLASSNPARPDPNPQNPRYHNADEFISDVRLIFQNCITFNGPDHVISLMGKRVEEVFDKQLKHLPPIEVRTSPQVKKLATPPPLLPPAPAKKAQPQRRASTSVPVIRRSDAEIGRPKREIHPPPPKDLTYPDIPKKIRKSKRAKDSGSEQLKFCVKLLNEMHKKQHWAMAEPFYLPVDYVKLDLPHYPKIVKKPMDLSTMRRKLENREYTTAERFLEDFKLMIRNCFSFNPAGTPVNQAGIELQRFFDERWKDLPPLRSHMSDDDDDDDEEESEDDDRQRTIAMMESQIETMRGNLAMLKGRPKEKKKKEKREKAPVASSSKSALKSSKKKARKHDDDVFTFDQKKDLSEAISQLEGSKLEKVISIIHEGVPEIRDSTEEIELEIDLLPPKVLTKLYNFVLRPLRPSTNKRNRPGKGTGTGGLKRKSMDEDVEAEKIRQLEQRMKLFEPTSDYPPPPIPKDDSDRSSDSSSGSDSSGSDSD